MMPRAMPLVLRWVANPDGTQQVVIVPVPGDDRSNGELSYYVYVNVGGVIQYYTVNVNISGTGFPVLSGIQHTYNYYCNLGRAYDSSAKSGMVPVTIL